jgi:hypothetical protein
LAKKKRKKKHGHKKKADDKDVGETISDNPRGEITTPRIHRDLQTCRPNELHMVLTGAPAGGKSTFLPLLQHLLQAVGFRVVVVSEVATTYFLSVLNLVLGKDSSDGGRVPLPCIGRLSIVAPLD